MKTLEDILPPSRRQAPPEHHEHKMHHAPRSRFAYATIVIALVVIAGAVGALFYFSGAKVEVTPAQSTVAVKGSYTATNGSGDLPFAVITAEKVASQSVKGSGTQTVNTVAKGTVTIYNTQAKVQRLITNTRFATASGLIFRIHDSVSVPAGTQSKPGSITATVYADKAGDTYNIGPSSFTLPGLSGTPQFSQVYAKSSGSMTGGASGTVPTVDPSTTATTRAALKTALTTDLQNALASQVPKGYVLLPSGISTTFQDLSNAPSATAGQVDVKEQGTIRAVVFQGASLARAIATNSIDTGYQGEPVSLAGNTLTLTAADLPNENDPTFTFSLSGNATLVWTIDSNRIASAVAGKSKTDAQTALTNYPEVKRAILVLRPFWRGSFPEDPASIEVVVNQPE